MRGAADRWKSEQLLAMYGAWQVARFTNYTDKLKPFGHYAKELREQGPKRAQTVAEQLSAWRAMQAGGAPLTITKLK